MYIPNNLLIDNLKRSILYILIGLTAYFAGEAIFKIMAEPTAGSIVRNNVKTGVMLVVLLLFYSGKLSFSFSGLSAVGTLSVKQWIVITTLGVLAGLVVFFQGGIATTYLGIVLFILICLGLSIFYIMTDRAFNALCLFWVVYPFVYFIENNISSLGGSVIYYCGLRVPFSGIYLLILFFVLAVCNFKVLFFDKKLFWVYGLVFLSIPSLFFSDEPFKSCVFFFFDIIIPVMYFMFFINSIKEKKQINIIIKFLLVFLSVLSNSNNDNSSL